MKLRFIIPFSVLLVSVYCIEDEKTVRDYGKKIQPVYAKQPAPVYAKQPAPVYAKKPDPVYTKPGAKLPFYRDEPYAPHPRNSYDKSGDGSHDGSPHGSNSKPHYDKHDKFGSHSQDNSHKDSHDKSSFHSHDDKSHPGSHDKHHYLSLSARCPVTVDGIKDFNKANLLNCHAVKSARPCRGKHTCCHGKCFPNNKLCPAVVPYSPNFCPKSQKCTCNTECKNGDVCCSSKCGFAVCRKPVPADSHDSDSSDSDGRSESLSTESSEGSHSRDSNSGSNSRDSSDRSGDHSYRPKPGSKPHHPYKPNSDKSHGPHRPGSKGHGKPKPKSHDSHGKPVYRPKSHDSHGKPVYKPKSHDSHGKPDSYKPAPAKPKPHYKPGPVETHKSVVHELPRPKPVAKAPYRKAQ